MTAIWLYSFDSGRATQVTGDMTDERSPAFDPKGRYLYFVSARDFQYQGYNSNFRSTFVLSAVSIIGAPTRSSMRSTRGSSAWSSRWSLESDRSFPRDPDY